MTQLVDATGGLVGGGAAPALPLPDIGAMMPRIQWLGDRYVITTTNYVNAYTSPVIFGNQTCK
jgi:hypothetical protein